MATVDAARETRPVYGNGTRHMETHEAHIREAPAIASSQYSRA